MRARLIGGFIVSAMAIALVVGVLLKPPGSGVAEARPSVGHTAPSFTLGDVTGRAVSLNDYRGHVVLLNFFATWCVPCTHEMPAISAAYRQHRSQLVVLAIDKQEPASDVESFTRLHHVAFTPLLDPNLTVWNQYKVTVQPVSFWVDRQGVIRAIHYGAMNRRYIAGQVQRLARA